MFLLLIGIVGTLVLLQHVGNDYREGVASGHGKVARLPSDVLLLFARARSARAEAARATPATSPAPKSAQPRLVVMHTQEDGVSRRGARVAARERAVVVRSLATARLASVSGTRLVDVEPRPRGV
jgi:hypothetical protein